MENLKELKPVGKLSPFTHFCCTIGNLPSSYMISLTYEEQLLWFCQYLEKTVIPAVNTNAEAVAELQNLYIQLKDYVDNYFTNLDVQEEINNKLDEMAQDGTLQEIILNYINLKTLLCFNTVADMKTANNLKNGSFTKTLGFYTLNDGGACEYYITNILPQNFTEPDFITLQNNLFAIPLNKNSIDVKQLGAKPDIENFDNSPFITSALKLFSRVTFSEGTFYVSNDINVPSSREIYFNTNALVKKIPTQNDVYRMFNLHRVHDVTFINPNICGDKDTHLSTSGENGFPLAITESQNIKIIGGNIEQAWGDGIYIGLRYYSNPEQLTQNILIDNVTLNNNSRNGITIGSGKNITIKNCTIKNTQRTSPKSGIDIEPELDDTPNLYLENIKIFNNYFEDNFSAVTFGLRNINNVNFGNIIIKDCYSYNCDYFSIYYEAKPVGNLIFENITVDNYKLPFDMALPTTISTLFKNITILNKSKNLGTDNNYKTVFYITAPQSYFVGNFTIEDVTIDNKNSQFPLLYFLNCVRAVAGTTTGSENIKLKNINIKDLSNNAILSSKHNLTFDNSIFEIISSTNSGFSVYNDVNKITFKNTGSYIASNINSSASDGYHEIILLNNTTLDVNILDSMTIENSSATKLRATKSGSYLRFYKNDLVITILDNNGFTEQQ